MLSFFSFASDRRYDYRNNFAAVCFTKHVVDDEVKRARYSEICDVGKKFSGSRNLGVAINTLQPGTNKIL